MKQPTERERNTLYIIKSPVDEVRPPVDVHWTAARRFGEQMCLRRLASLLLGDTNSAATSSGRLRVLTAHSETPVMTKTPVGTDLLESLKILAHLIVQTIGKDLAELAILNVLLSVEEPIWDLVLTRVVHDRNDTLNLFLREFSGTLGHVDVSFLADDVRESSTTTFDTRHSEHDLTTAINVRVHHTKNVLKLFWHH